MYRFVNRSKIRRALICSCAIYAVSTSAVFAQTTPSVSATSSQPDAKDSTNTDIVVTGSRIHRDVSDTVAPVSVITLQNLTERGYVQPGEALNTLPSITPSFAVSPGNGDSSGNGQQYPNLFGLGAGRTLTLVDGRRMVTTSSGLGDRSVDTNIIPTGLIQRIDIVQAGGAAVYGSDAIAGVVNYVLKDKFSGLEVDAQSGISTHGDYPRYSLRATAGKNFAEGRGNIAVDVEWRKTDPLLFGSRKITQPVYQQGSNPYDTSTKDGIPATVPIADPRFWEFNANGVITTDNYPDQSVLLAQFTPSGTGVQPFNPGNQYVRGFACDIPFCSGGDGYPYGNLSALYSGVETRSATALGHYDLTDNLKLSGQFLYSDTKARDPLGMQSPQTTILDSATPFTRDNPFLTPAAIAQLSALSPAFASGGTLYVSKAFDDLLPTREVDYRTKVWRANIALDGKFMIGDRKFYYSAAYSHGDVRSRQSGWNINTNNFYNALDASRNASGQIVCTINAVTVTDAACAPINPFGVGNISAAARAYATVPVGSVGHSTQDDALVTLGGDLVSLPAGKLRFSAGYEHRNETASFTPSRAEQLGIAGYGNVVSPASGRYHTNELSAELLLPIVGGDFTLPLVKALELDGQYRYVDNSLAGKQSVWGAGARWEVVDGLTLRGSRSRNFRAPSLDQLTTPRATFLTQTIDPCDKRQIGSGPAPAARQAYCQALFAANPGWGPLGSFIDPSTNNPVVAVATGGNPSLQNEISDTTTFGVAFQPRFVPGRLQFTADRIHVKLRNGLTAFAADDFAAACSDTTPTPSDICGTLTRNSSTGYITSAVSTTYNAALVDFKGDVFAASYGFPLRWITGGESGSLDLGFDATHTRSLLTNVRGVVKEAAGSVRAPDWVIRFTANYAIGRFKLNYQLYRLPRAKVSPTATIETTYMPYAASNTRHDISVSYDFDKLQLRAGVDNLTDRQVSAPTYSYGDILGRQIYVGAKIRY